jgi:hypothetical protein
MTHLCGRAVTPDRRTGARSGTCDCEGGDAPNERFGFCRSVWVRLAVRASRHGRWDLFKRVPFAHCCSDSLTGTSMMLTSLWPVFSAGMG